MRIISFASLLILTLCLQGCWQAVGTAAVGGALIYKRQAIEQTIDDQHITSEIQNVYFTNGELWEDNRIIVSTVNGYVLLTGQVRTGDLRQEAQTLAESIPGSSRIYNQISVATPITLFQQIQDAYITLSIKTNMMLTKNFDPSAVKIITDNGIVYLMGVVEPKQADQAASIASNTNGVTKVVKVFQYITS